jgi:hypothetical protein
MHPDQSENQAQSDFPVILPPEGEREPEQLEPDHPPISETQAESNPDVTQPEAADLSADLSKELTEPESLPGDALPDLATIRADAAPPSSQPPQPDALVQKIALLQQQEQDLKVRVEELKAVASQLQAQNLEMQSSLGRLVQEGLRELEQRKQTLQVSVEQLERRQERIRAEMRKSFAGVSQDLAIRVQSFKDYLVGSLQDLSIAAEQLDLPKPIAKGSERIVTTTTSEIAGSTSSPTPKFAEQSFQDQTRRIRSLLDQYRNRPDYYGAPWQLRRTFEPVHAERVSNWFFTQGGRGAIRTMGSRLQNILIASAAISILRELYDDRLRALVLAQTPERLGEWRRGLQDCLGISRSDFTPERGVALFEAPEPLSLKADRLVKDGLLPFVIIDETEDQISLAILQYPLWLAFAVNPQQQPSASFDNW